MQASETSPKCLARLSVCSPHEHERRFQKFLNKHPLSTEIIWRNISPLFIQRALLFLCLYWGAQGSFVVETRHTAKRIHTIPHPLCRVIVSCRTIVPKTTLVSGSKVDNKDMLCGPTNFVPSMYAILAVPDKVHSKNSASQPDILVGNTSPPIAGATNTTGNMLIAFSQPASLNVGSKSNPLALTNTV